ncbi:MAG: DUF1552 domain-containing protein, partial [Proteobacteria bacterium]
MERRMFLKSSSGLCLAIPFLESLLSPEEARAQSGTPKSFLITMRNGCGREHEMFWQAGDGAIVEGQNTGKSVAVLKPYFSKMLFVNGATPTITKNVRSGGCSHGVATANLLTCGDFTGGNNNGMEAAHEISFDYYLHKAFGGTGNPIVAQLGYNSGKKHRISWSAREQEIAATFNPLNIYT